MWEELQIEVDKLPKARYKEGQIFSRRRANHSESPFRPWKQVKFLPLICLFRYFKLITCSDDDKFIIFEGGQQLQATYRDEQTMKSRISGIPT